MGLAGAYEPETSRFSIACIVAAMDVCVLGGKGSAADSLGRRECKGKIWAGRHSTSLDALTQPAQMGRNLAVMIRPFSRDKQCFAAKRSHQALRVGGKDPKPEPKPNRYGYSILTGQAASL